MQNKSYQYCWKQRAYTSESIIDMLICHRIICHVAVMFQLDIQLIVLAIYHTYSCICWPPQRSRSISTDLYSICHHLSSCYIMADDYGRSRDLDNPLMTLRLLSRVRSILIPFLTRNPSRGSATLDVSGQARPITQHHKHVAAISRPETLANVCRNDKAILKLPFNLRLANLKIPYS